MYKFLFFFLTFGLLSCNNETDTKTNKPEVVLSNSSDPFIQGLTHIIKTTTRKADKGFKYEPHFSDTTLSPIDFEYLIDLELAYMKAYYDIENDIITGYLPINIDYNFDHALLLGKRNDNDLIFGEYDFNNDGVNEIIIGLRDNNASSMGMQINVIRYIPPPKTETVFCDYWVTIKDFHFENVNPSSYVSLVDNQLSLIDNKQVTSKFVFSKSVFDKAIPETE